MFRIFHISYCNSVSSFLNMSPVHSKKERKKERNGKTTFSASSGFTSGIRCFWKCALFLTFFVYYSAQFVYIYLFDFIVIGYGYWLRILKGIEPTTSWLWDFCLNTKPWLPNQWASRLCSNWMEDKRGKNCNNLNEFK